MGLLTFDLTAIKANYALLQAEVGEGCRVAAMVKADAYGCGMPPLALALYEAGAQDFFVATLDEALLLRTILPLPVPVYMLNGFHSAESGLYLEHGITPVLNTLETLTSYHDLAINSGQNLPAILHVDTGMNRLGLSARDLVQLDQTPALRMGLDLKYVMSHFACADEATHPMNEEQYGRFSKISAFFPDIPRSLANSSGIFRSPAYHFEMVRPGMALYGLNPTPETHNPMKPAISLEIPLLQTRTALKGETCGYSASYIFERDTPLGIVALGYADGFLRALSNKGQVFWDGIPCPVRGRVSMDVVIVDLSAIPESRRPVAGNSMEVIGPHQTVDTLAASAGTLGYEILTSLGSRYKKRYVS